MDHLKLCLMQPWSTPSHIWFVHLGMQFFVVKRKWLLGFLCFIPFLFPPHWAPEDDQLIMLCLQAFLELLQPLATAGGSWELSVSHLAPGIDYTLPKAHLSPASRGCLGLTQIPKLRPWSFKNCALAGNHAAPSPSIHSFCLLQDLLQCSWVPSHFGW